MIIDRGRSITGTPFEMLMRSTVYSREIAMKYKLAAFEICSNRLTKTNEYAVYLLVFTIFPDACF
jgi:hypothetical protein